MKLDPPTGYELVEADGARAFAVPRAVGWVRSVLEGGRTLHREAARNPVATFRGRGEVHVVDAPEGRWVVRHYRRGGAMARLLDDRYVRVGDPRPVREAVAAAEVARRGIHTPGVVAGAVYPAGLFYRADLLTALVPDGMDLAGVLFGPAEGGGHVRAQPHGQGVSPGDPALRGAALRAAGSLVARMAGAGVAHPDLNAGNVLLTGVAGDLRPLLLDLDRCRVLPRGRGLDPQTLLARLERSLRKLGDLRGPRLERDEWDVLRAAVRSAADRSGT